MRLLGVDVKLLEALATVLVIAVFVTALWNGQLNGLVGYVSAPAVTVLQPDNYSVTDGLRLVDYDNVVQGDRARGEACRPFGPWLANAFGRAHVPADSCWATALWRMLRAEGKIPPVLLDWGPYRGSLMQNRWLGATLDQHAGVFALDGVLTTGWMVREHWTN